MSKMYVYLTQYSRLQGKDLHAQTAEQLAEGTHLSSSPDMSGDGWVKVGEAQVQFALYPRADVVADLVAGYREQITKTHAAAGAVVLRLEGQINSLLCIEGAASEVVA